MVWCIMQTLSLAFFYYYFSYTNTSELETGGTLIQIDYLVLQYNGNPDGDQKIKNKIQEQGENYAKSQSQA